MPNDWIIDVLSDLRTYAFHNGLNALAKQLDDATMIAAMEIASRDDETAHEINWNSATSGRISNAAPERQRA